MTNTIMSTSAKSIWRTAPANPNPSTPMVDAIQSDRESSLATKDSIEMATIIAGP